jgi:type 1 glutamine amidotransferase
MMRVEWILGWAGFATGTLGLVAGTAIGAEAIQPAGGTQVGPAGKKIVFLWHVDHHPNEAGCILFRHCLENAANVKGIRCEVHEWWPPDPATLDDAAAIVVFSDRSHNAKVPHPIFTAEHNEHLDRLMKKGTGLVALHFSLFCARAMEAPKLTEWIGAYYDFEGYGSRHFLNKKPMEFSPVTPGHTISRGWKAFTLPANEAYHNLRYAETDATVPILSAPFTEARALKGPKANVTVWALERPDGGRGVGVGIGHYYENWLNDDLRKMALNAIVWAAKIEVPETGVESAVPEELKKPKRMTKSVPKAAKAN